MRLGTVIGRITLHRQEPAYAGGHLLVVQPLARSQFAKAAHGVGPIVAGGGPNLVVYDRLGAGQGALIGFTEGAEASQPFEDDAPVDAYCACIVDQVLYDPPR